ncbi:DUF5991 domain-containing protein [Cupriavidus sp. 2TAF22]|uniref:DUF5991 domain-containing protein n=1 Tax=unclassified Cupriavidus TaxID=2640874 RepID=UPI003F8E3516
MTIRLILACLLGVFPPMGMAGQYGHLKPRYGSYGYADQFSDGIQPIITDIIISIDPGGKCDISWQGFQQDQKIMCTTKAIGNKINILFFKFSDGKTINQYGVAPYSPHECLLSLHKDDGDLVTKWGKNFSPPGVKKSDHYFRKQP